MAKKEHNFRVVYPSGEEPVLDIDAIPLYVWEELAEETARYIRELLRDPETRAMIMPEK